jgi:Antitoxin Phd_YefM, type II toxin-antitoxin system
MKEWKLQEAKENFSEIFDLASKGNEQFIMQEDKRILVVMSFEDYMRLEQKSISLLDIFSSAPRLDENELPLKRDRTSIKPFELE